MVKCHFEGAFTTAYRLARTDRRDRRANTARFAQIRRLGVPPSHGPFIRPATASAFRCDSLTDERRGASGAGTERPKISVQETAALRCLPLEEDPVQATGQ